MTSGRFFGALIAPRATFAAMADAAPREGAPPVIAAGLGWAALALVLAANGEAPSRPAPFIDGEVHYLAQAIFVVPLFAISWLVYGAVAGRIAGGTTYAPLGYAYGVPLLVTWALPDAIALGTLGFDALAPLVRVVAPLTAVYTVALGAVAVRAATRCSVGRAVGASLGGAIAQALVGAWALR